MSAPEDEPLTALAQIASSIFAINVNMLYLKDLLDRFSVALNNPDGEIHKSMHDVLETYGQLTQFREIASNQRDQTQALAAAMGLYLTRMIEHDRRVITYHDEVLQLLHAFASGADPAEIARQAQTARDLLAQEDAARHAAEELSAEDARKLLRLARIDERGKIAAAANAAEKEIAAAEAGALSVVADAESAARDQIEHEKESSE